MIEPAHLTPMVQQSTGDCGLVCLALLLERPYSDLTRVMTPARLTYVQRQGMSLRYMRTLAERLGHSIGFRAGRPEDDETGILSLTRRTEDDGHVVLWLRSIIFNPADGTIWTSDQAFLNTGHWKIDSFLWRVK